MGQFSRVAVRGLSFTVNAGMPTVNTKLRSWKKHPIRRSKFAMRLRFFLMLFAGNSDCSSGFYFAVCLLCIVSMSLRLLLMVTRYTPPKISATAMTFVRLKESMFQHTATTQATTGWT